MKNYSSFCSIIQFAWRRRRHLYKKKKNGVFVWNIYIFLDNDIISPFSNATGIEDENFEMCGHSGCVFIIWCALTGGFSLEVMEWDCYFQTFFCRNVDVKYVIIGKLSRVSGSERNMQNLIQ